MYTNFWGRHSHTQIIDWWNHKQRSWPPIIHCGSMPWQYIIATGIHSGSMRQKFKSKRHSHKTYTVDLCVANYTYSIATWITNIISRVFNLVAQSTNLTMWLHVLNSNMVETTWLPVIDVTVNNCERNHHWCQWLPTYYSTIHRLWINELISNIRWTLSIRGQWCKPSVEREETFHWGMQAPRYWIISKSWFWIMSWSRRKKTRHRRPWMYPPSMTWNE